MAEDAEAAAVLTRRSIIELCRDDHLDDANTVAAWTANKTPDNLRSCIAGGHVLVCVFDGVPSGIVAMPLHI